MKTIRIVSGGTTLATKVFCGESEVTGISRIDIAPMVAGGDFIVRAVLTFDLVALDIVAESGDDIKAES